MKAIDPPPRAGQYIVLLGVEPVRDGNPIFDQPTLRRALPFWLDVPGLRASSYFEPHAEGFRALRSGRLIPYEALRLFRYAHGLVEEVSRVELPNGRIVELAAGRAPAGP